MPTLRSYQLAALDRVRTAWREGTNRQLVKMATGLGKTPFLASLPDALGFRRRMMVLVHREELAQQAAEKLRHWNPGRSVGIEMAGQRAVATDQLVVGSVQTLGRKGSSRLGKFAPDDFDAVVVDECHHSTAESYLAVLRHFGVFDQTRCLCLGLTATPNRADGQGLGEVFQDVVFDMGILQGIREGWLADLRGYRVRTGTALDSVRSRGGDFVPKELEEAINTEARNHLVVRAWQEYGDSRPTIVFAVDVKHAKDLADRFREYNIPAEAIWGEDPERQDKLRRHRAGDLRVLVNCQVLTEGYDDWRVSCIVLARPTQSELLYTQVVGRGTRIPDGLTNLLEARQRGQAIAKEDCILIDVVDVTRQHSLVTLPVLFGLHPSLNLQGRSVSEVVKDAEAVQAAMPKVDVRRITDLVDLRRYVEEVDLLGTPLPPELMRVSPNRWRREGKGTYLLALPKGESLAVVCDALGRWQAMGTVSGQKVREVRASLEDAVRAADASLQRGGAPVTALVSREAKWRSDPASDAQVRACRQWGIRLPLGATKGQACDLLDAKLARR